MKRLNEDNYYTKEIDQYYCSASQYKAWLDCPAKMLAELDGEYEREPTTALLVGGYVDAAIEGTLDDYKAKHPEMFKKDGTLKADFTKAEEAVARIKQDKLFQLMLDGKKQVIVKSVIQGVPFKGKLDVVLSKAKCQQIVKAFPEMAQCGMDEFCDGAIVDLKYVKDFDDVWDEEQHKKVPFIEYWHYDAQLAIYQRLYYITTGKILPCYIAAITKQDNPDIQIFYIPQEVLDEQLALVAEEAPKIQVAKKTRVRPEGCGHCDYCRSHKKLTTAVDYRYAI